jgi:hypothetical protein
MLMLLYILSLNVLSSSALARNGHYGYHSYRSGGTHYVRPHYRKGLYIRGHRAGNPRSGIHCHDTVCR